MRRFFTQILALALLVSLLGGCGRIPEEPTDAAAAPSQVPEPAAATEAAASTADLSEEVQPADEAEQLTITWATAFRDESVPEGVLTEDSIAFLHRSSDGTVRVFNVPKEELYAQQPERLPRTRFFEQYMPRELIDELLPVLDYAVENGCSRFCIPATSVSYSMIKKASRYLSYTYDINNQSRIDPLPIKSFSLEDGTLNYLLITIYGMEKGNTIDRYREGLAAAHAIVDAMPDGLDEKGKMLYLYRYLTENVRYFNGESYYLDQGEADWCLLYDALVQQNTIGNGYTEALYVLCNLAGIECFNVTGEAVEAYDTYIHVRTWNVARINGQYYQFDAGLDADYLPADYLFFGMSEDYAQEHHTSLMRSFDREFCPPCPENLLPTLFYPSSQYDPTVSIFRYYLLCNARDAAPEKLFLFCRYAKDDIQSGEPKDGWVTTEIDMEEFCRRLRSVMTPYQVDIFTADCLKSDKDGKLMYRVPEKTPNLLRLVDVVMNMDGSWTASLLVITPDGRLIPWEQRITLESYMGRMVVASVMESETPLPV